MMGVPSVEAETLDCLIASRREHVASQGPLSRSSAVLTKNTTDDAADAGQASTRARARPQTRRRIRPPTLYRCRRLASSQPELLDRELAHVELLDLAGDGHRIVVDDLPVAGDLEGGDAAAAGGGELLPGDGGAVAQPDPGHDLL